MRDEGVIVLSGKKMERWNGLEGGRGSCMRERRMGQLGVVVGSRLLFSFLRERERLRCRSEEMGREGLVVVV